MNFALAGEGIPFRYQRRCLRPEHSAKSTFGKNDVFQYTYAILGNPGMYDWYVTVYSGRQQIWISGLKRDGRSKWECTGPGRLAFRGNKVAPASTVLEILSP
jgi:hypothetical protein